MKNSSAVKMHWQNPCKRTQQKYLNTTLQAFGGWISRKLQVFLIFAGFWGVNFAHFEGRISRKIRGWISRTWRGVFRALFDECFLPLNLREFRAKCGAKNTHRTVREIRHPDFARNSRTVLCAKFAPRFLREIHPSKCAKFTHISGFLVCMFVSAS